MFIYTWQIVSEPGIDEALSLLGYEGFFSVFFGLFDLMKQVDLLTGLEGMDSMTGSFISDLVIGYIISGIATVAIGLSMLKKTDKTNKLQTLRNTRRQGNRPDRRTKVR